jgi:hypothetical protein
MGWTVGWLGFEFWWGLGIFLFDTISIPALGPNQLPIQWVLGALFLGVKLTAHLHLVLMLKNVWHYTSTPPVHLHGMVLS